MVNAIACEIVMEYYNNAETQAAASSIPLLETQQINILPDFRDKSIINLPSSCNEKVTEQINDSLTYSLLIHSESMKSDSALITKSKDPVTMLIVETNKPQMTSLQFPVITVHLSQIGNLSQEKQNLTGNHYILHSNKKIEMNSLTDKIENNTVNNTQSPDNPAMDKSVTILENVRKLQESMSKIKAYNTKPDLGTVNSYINLTRTCSKNYHVVTKVNNSLNNNVFITSNTKVNNIVGNNVGHTAHTKIQNSYGENINIMNKSKINNAVNSKLQNTEKNSKSEVSSDITKKSSTKRDIAKIQYHSHMSDQIVPPRAVAVLPPSLHFYKNAVYPQRVLLPWTRLGPVNGVERILSPKQAEEVVSKCAIDTPVFFIKKGFSYDVVNIDVSDADKSNWFNLLSLGEASSANVCIYEEDGELYGITTRRIPARTSLKLCYSKQYAEMYGLHGHVIDLVQENSKSRQWLCPLCEKDFSSADLYVKHKKLCFKANILLRGKKHRCKHCHRAFARVATLRRHMKVCLKKNNTMHTYTEQSSNTIKDPAPSLNESKIPSDESFQNINLDFSTNLFDTDRIPNFDLSSSKSDCDFNNLPGYKDDFDLEFTRFAKGLEHGSELAKGDEQQKNRFAAKSKRLPKCTFCDDEHQKPCLKTKRYHCKCKKVFTKKSDYERHTCQYRSNAHTSKTGPPSVPSKYVCEECNIVFQRRGMLVIHLWRRHGQEVETALEKRVRHYPCAVCPKLYLTACKRKQHMAMYHSDFTGEVPDYVLGAKIATTAAQCSFCVRQYSTRAKLLQHMRQHHPDKAPPIRVQKKMK